jgi:hypothetical protein
MSNAELKAQVLETVRKCGRVSVFMVRAMLMRHQGIRADFGSILDALDELVQDNLVACGVGAGARIFWVKGK